MTKKVTKRKLQNLPKVQVNTNGKRFVKIGNTKYFLERSALKKSGLTERELIFKLVELLTKKKKRATRNKKSESVKPTVQENLERAQASIPVNQKCPPLYDPAVREYLKLLNLSEASTQKALEEQKVKTERKSLPAPDKKESKDDQKELLKADIEHKGRKLEIRYKPEDAGAVNDYVSDVAAQGRLRGELKAFESVAETNALSKWTKSSGGINKVRGMLKSISDVNWTDIRQMNARELYEQINNYPESDLYTKAQGAFDDVYNQELTNIIKKAEVEAKKLTVSAESLEEEEDLENVPVESLFSPNSQREFKELEEQINQQAKGKSRIVSRRKVKIPPKGLSTDQINEIMSDRRSFLGAIPRDYIHKLKGHIKPGKTASFIVNLDPHDKPGLHWVAMVLLPKKARVLYFDSFGRPCPEDMRKQVKQLIKVSMPGEIPIFKENLIKVQRADSINCGPFAMKFIEDTLDGIPFIKATPYDKSLDGEKKIRKYIQTLPKFATL